MLNYQNMRVQSKMSENKVLRHILFIIVVVHTEDNVKETLLKISQKCQYGKIYYVQRKITVQNY